MSGTFPENPKAKEIELSSNQPITTTISSSGRRQSRKTEGHLWNITAKYDIMTRENIAPLFAFSASQGASSFQIILPERKIPIGDASGTPTAGNAARGSGSIGISGLSGTLKAGDIIKFSNHSKVYMLYQDSTSTISFFPDLIENVAGGAITINNVPFTVFIPDDIVKWKTRAPVISTYELKMTEAI